MPLALGFIESNSLIAVIEAANVMAKTPGVFLTGKEVLPSGLITIKIIGDIDVVKLAVKNGEEAAKKLEKSVLSYVCADPDKQLITILPEISNFYFQNGKLPETEKLPEAMPERKKEPSKVEPKPKIKSRQKKKLEKPVRNETEIQKPVAKEITNIKNDTITRLRMEALGAGKLSAEDSEKESSSEGNNINIESLNVHQLRRLARDSENFPIQGREISKAKREDLLKYFKKLN
jgi:microcompartment protein CcmL/EutN